MTVITPEIGSEANLKMTVDSAQNTSAVSLEMVESASTNITDKEVVIMHPGPINRGIELTSDVADSSQAIILDQVENGVAVRMAVMYLLASKRN